MTAKGAVTAEWLEASCHVHRPRVCNIGLHASSAAGLEVPPALPPSAPAAEAGCRLRAALDWRLFADNVEDRPFGPLNICLGGTLLFDWQGAGNGPAKCKVVPQQTRALAR